MWEEYRDLDRVGASSGREAKQAMAKGGGKKNAAARAAANRLLADNRLARHQYDILETLETGIELVLSLIHI